LLGGAEVEPDAPETFEGAEVGMGDVHVVVPQQAATEGGPVGDPRGKT
jgi:hypothetical protein